MGTTIEPMDRTVMYNKNQQLLEEIKLFKGQELSDDEEGKEGGRRKFKGKGKPFLKSWEYFFLNRQN